ncbi:MAG: ABC transporter permease subunit [bacterium]
MRQLATLISKEIYVRRWSLLGFTLGSVAFLLLYVLIYPSFQNESAKFNELLQSYPKAVLKAFNIENLQFSSIEGYISAEHFSFVWPLLAIFLSISMAGNSIAGEIEKATMAITLSLPLKRGKIYMSKALSGLIAIGGFAAVTTLSLIPLSMINNVSLNYGHVVKISILGILFALAIYSLALMFSAIYSEKSKVYFWAGGILVSMYVANIVSGLVSSLKNFQYVSLFHYFAADKAITQGIISLQSVAVFTGLSVASLAIGYLVFIKRDISV